ncbi:hypothetical protein TRFO_07544 [Tritrichomonas foetus]|uniref:Uncharacterized protein n=1 Tax=Tritrichomonas foetus TaxID=1144522 RepID=A0A1J4JS89_9EUKA|nr:hypothetical protein TRFO_07544 [Tritrichomonas foetus]|eukprot:OHT01626.1 hypothetical protein TRFO_07544 [Tritrichomonas foetus]
MFFVFLNIVLCDWDDATKCGNLFMWRYNFCKEDSGFADKDGTGKAQCSLYVPFYMPVGWYEYTDSMYSQFSFIETESTISSSGAPDVRNAAPSFASDKKDGPHDTFDKECPMYDGKTIPNQTSCCLHKYQSMFEADYTASFMKIEEFKKQYQFRIYPKCYDLLRYMPCAICHPKVQEENVSFIVGSGMLDGYNLRMPIITYRLCNDYAETIYKHCRGGFFIGNQKKHIVPKKMGLEQFKDLMGVPELHGLASDKCMDIQDVNPFYYD